MTAPEPEPRLAPYEALVARHLRTIAGARLFVGDGLTEAHWDGLNETFGPLLAAHPDDAIVAVYDDSAFGRGRAGFVLTDAGLHVVPGWGGVGAAASVPLAHVRRTRDRSDGVVLFVADDAREPAASQRPIHLRVDEPDARAAVTAFLAAVVRHNADTERRQRRRTVTVEQAIERIEHALAAGEALPPAQRDRLRSIGERMEARAARRARRSDPGAAP